MKFGLFFMISMALAFYSKGQDEKIMINGHYLTLWRFDKNTCYEFGKSKKRIYWNNNPIDSSGLSQFCALYSKDVLLIGSRDKTSSKVFHSIDRNGHLKYLSKIQHCVLYASRNNFYLKKSLNVDHLPDRITHFYDRNFYKLDKESGAISTFYDIDAVSGLDSLSPEDLCALYELPNNKLIATLCYCAYGGCSDFKYFLVDIETAEIKKLALKVKEPDNEFYSIRFLDDDGKYFLIKIDNYGGKKENGGHYILDTHFDEISPALEHSDTYVGSNYTNEKLISDNVKTTLDDGKEVIIQYKFSMPLERSLYRLFSNDLLLPEDLEHCNAHELDLIRNMTFAKHNFKFRSEFYQAYFNFYAFYGQHEKRNSRITNVSQLLTPIDKTNLLLVANASKDK